MSSVPSHDLPRRHRFKSEVNDLAREFQQSGLSIADFARKVGVLPAMRRPLALFSFGSMGVGLSGEALGSSLCGDTARVDGRR